MGFVGSVEDWAIYGELMMDGEEGEPGCCGGLVF